ncbi:general secretion pathway protein D [Bradyrhizobium sp. AZCC 1678]|uniref:type II secretion system secretin GspD n=1 Tax=Bradyrhizobium sp. AZCC 1678 TaxID=3117030 RepID=UPI002FF13568
MPEIFLFQARIESRWLVVAVALGMTGCQTISESPPPADETDRVMSVARLDDGKSAATRSRAMALPANKNDPAAGAELIHRGTGQLIGSAKARPSAGSRDEDGVTVNLVNASIAEAAKTILGDILGLNYSLNTKLEGKITIQTSTPISQSELVALFQNALRASGVTLVRSGNAYQLEPADQASRSISEIAVGGNIEPGGIVGSSVRVVQLKYVAASEMRRILEPMVQKGAILRADDARNTLTLSGTGSDVAAMLDAISVFDIDIMNGMSVTSVPVRATQPDAIVDDLRAIFGTDKEGPMSGMVRFIPNQRLKSILVISPQQRYLARAERAIRNLDANARGPDKQLFTYNARNRPAKELVGVVESIFSSSRGSTQNGREVAPRYQEAAVQTAQAAPSSNGTPSYGAPASSAGAGSPIGGGINLNGQSAVSASSAGSTPSDASSQSKPSLSAAQPGEDERVRLSVDESNNTLLILASRQDYRRVLQIVQSVDVVPDQVLIEATIAEVSLNDDLQFGVRWSLDSKKGSFSLTDAAAAAFGSTFPGFSYALAAVNAKVALNALNAITKVNVISSPTLTVLNNRTATLQIGDQVPIVTQSAVGVVATGAPIVNSVNYRDTGVILSITPRINESGRVLLSIEQEVSSVASTTTSSIDSPTIKQRRVKTTVLVNNGESLTLGGLIQDQVSDARNQLPILGDIPLIGNVFRQKNGSIGKTELIILITPHVMRNLNEAREITDEYRRKFDVGVPHLRGARRPIERTIMRTLN